MSEENNLLQVVQSRRTVRSVGLVLGTVVVGTGFSLGYAGNLIDDRAVAAVLIALGSAAAAVLLMSFDSIERSECLPSSLFRIGASAAGKGQGLFACAPISAGTYMFDYDGDRLTEEQFFSRYPDAKGRYVACIDSYLPWIPPSYIDGANPDSSGIARWMNHSRRRANVRWKKQRFGARMHFYAATDINAGDELMFDYGETYWTALGVEPIDQ